MLMKKLLMAAFAASTLGLAACDSAREDAAEDRAEDAPQ